jgi:hypothetical protein
LEKQKTRTEKYLVFRIGLNELFLRDVLKIKSQINANLKPQIFADETMKYNLKSASTCGLF